MYHIALKINMKHNNEGLEDDFPFQKNRCSVFL